jgi:hypothetical protein
MPCPLRLAALCLVTSLLLPAGLHAQVGGDLARFPPVDLHLDITTSPDGQPVLSASEFRLITGQYYRFIVSSDGAEEWRLEAHDLLQNSHLRVVTIEGIEVHLQGMVFRAIEFDVGGSARFSFTPIRPGTYALAVGVVPRLAGRPIGQAGLEPDSRAAVATVIVE